ncbi:hypothetical protein TNCV_5015031 [Trichonephila clavipes]|nr:hypothetical protein TNCV_5015031 [Trichonephila clavipes]
MVQRSREKDEKQQHINGKENIVLKFYTTAGVRKCMELFFWGHIKSLVSSFLHLRTQYVAADDICHARNLQKRKEFQAPSLSGLPDDFWP